VEPKVAVTRRGKFLISLVIAVASALLILSAAAELQGSFGSTKVAWSGGIKLAIGFVAFGVSAPVAVYLLSRLRRGKSIGQRDVEVLLGKKSKE
jgi:hypothetical protein